MAAVANTPTVSAAAPGIHPMRPAVREISRTRSSWATNGTRALTRSRSCAQPALRRRIAMGTIRSCPKTATDAMPHAGRPMAPPAATNMYKPTTA